MNLPPEYTPRPPLEEVNFTPPGSHLKQLGILVLGVLGIIAVLYMLAGLAVNALAPYIPASVEISVGRLVEHALPVVENPGQSRRLNALLKTLLPHMGEEAERLPYRVVVSNDPTVNAVALPGGKIVVFTGLLDILDSDEEIVFVLAHELGHFAHRDHIKKLGRGVLALSLAIMLTGQDSWVSETVSSMALGVENTYSRGQEYRADEYALALLRKATGSDRAAFSFMDKVLGLDNTGPLFHYFATHPHPADRLRNLKNKKSD